MNAQRRRFSTAALTGAALIAAGQFAADAVHAQSATGLTAPSKEARLTVVYWSAKDCRWCTW
ncbi:MAG: hypothetical protein ACK4XK_03135 [Casimicrobiaceae bacterium]